MVVQLEKFLEGSDLGESLGVESRIEVGSSFGFSGVFVEIKLEGSSVEYYRVFSGSRVDMEAVLAALGADVVAVAAVVARASALRSAVRCSWVVGEEN